jgi:hypothetical protein
VERKVIYLNEVSVLFLGLILAFKKLLQEGGWKARVAHVTPTSCQAGSYL